MLLGVGKLVLCHWRFEVEVANVEAAVTRTFNRNSTVDVKIGSSKVRCRRAKVALSDYFIAAHSNSDSMCLNLLGSNVTDWSEVYW